MLGCIIEEVKEIFTKNNDKMVFMRLGDMTGSIEAVIFPKVYEEFRDILAVDNCVVVKGTVDGNAIAVDSISPAAASK